MENYIVINGKKAELTPEQLKALGLETEIKSPFEMKAGELYWHITSDGRVISEYANIVNYYADRHNVANYCTDRKMLQQQAYRETLNRLLWRYSMEHKGNEIEWGNDKQKYQIWYCHKDKDFRVTSYMCTQFIGSVYFTKKEIAQNAIKEIIEPFMAEHPDFKF